MEFLAHANVGLEVKGYTFQVPPSSFVV